MYLGLDLGTSGLKGVLIDAQGRSIGFANAPLTVERPNEGWSEQNPENWITAAKVVLDQLTKRFPAEMGALHGIGLSGQMHGATLIDRIGQPLRPCILWNDTRSFNEAATLDAQPDFRAISGNIVFPGFTAPKIMWVKHHEPEIFDKINKVLLPKDYLRLWLTGEAISDMSDSAGTSWLNVENRDWSDALLGASHMTRAQMPALVEGNAEGGILRDILADRWGLPKGIIVAGGAGDNAASAIGMGVIKAGQAFLSLGTSGVLFAANDAYLPNPESAVHTFCHALPDRWHQMGVILSATDSLGWYGKITGRSPEALTAALGDRLHPPGNAIFLPYLGGERTPHNDAKIRSSFLGLSHNDTRESLTRAVIEGVGFTFADNLAALRGAGTKIERALAVGGDAQSRYWLKTIATILDIPIDIPVAGDFGAALGAARLGLMAATKAAAIDVCTPPKIAETVMPVTELVAPFQAKYQHFKSAYPAPKGH